MSTHPKSKKKIKNKNKKKISKEKKTLLIANTIHFLNKKKKKKTITNYQSNIIEVATISLAGVLHPHTSRATGVVIPIIQNTSRAHDLLLPTISE
jgi:hypothetical protein